MTKALILIFISNICFAANVKTLQPLLSKEWKLIEKGDHIVKSTMQDHNDGQKLNYFAIALHPKNCRFALRKISQYELYEDYIEFIKSSSYNERTRQLNFVMDHTLLPFKIGLRFKIDRVESPGDYKFVFEHGFLKNLKGDIKVTEYKNRCLMQMHANWQGPDTKINNTVFEIFSKTLGLLGISKIFRISRI